MGELVIGFFGLLASSVLLIAGVTGSGIPSVVRGNPDRKNSKTPTAPGATGGTPAGDGGGVAGAVAGAATASGPSNVSGAKITDERSWAAALLAKLAIPQTTANMAILVGWERAEGGHWHNTAKYNPLNTTQPEPGAGNTGTQGNIKVYTSWDQGLDATVKTLNNGLYKGILAALRHGTPTQGASAIAGSPWGTKDPLVSQTIAAAAH